MRALVPRGTPIAAIAPCGAYDVAKLEAGLAIARERGHTVVPLPGNLDPVRYLAASDEVRATQLVEALASEEYGAVWLIRGGFGLTRILDRIPFDTLPRRPILGFSDMTALVGPMLAAGAGPVIHGPMLHSLAATDAASTDHLFALLAGEPTPPLVGDPWIEGVAEGPLVGGNLCLLAATCGTPWQVNARGAILVLEEIGEYAYRVDRMLQQLSSAGVLEGVAGVALGEMASCRVPEGAEWGIETILLEHLRPLDVPVLANLPIGHGAANRAFVEGQPGRMSGGVLQLAGMLSS